MGTNQSDEYLVQLAQNLGNVMAGESPVTAIQAALLCAAAVSEKHRLNAYTAVAMRKLAGLVKAGKAVEFEVLQ